MKEPIKEDSFTEFKSSFSEKVIETLVAFANTKGGKVLVGIDDQGRPLKGFNIGTESIQNWLNEIKNKTHPSIIPEAETKVYNNSNIVELSIKEFPIKPVSFRGRYYKRVKNSNHQLNLSEISELHLKTFNSSWDSYVNPEYSMSMISLDKVKEFINKCNKDREVMIKDNPLTVLKKFNLIKEGGITSACYLLFGNGYIFDANIELGRFSTPTSIKDGLTVRSDLFSEVEEVLGFIKKQINKEYIITGDPQREERWQYPLKALREIITNMIVH
jgi:ATP-dependent DNA helicase RecG